MKTKIKTGMATTVSLAFLLLTTIAASVYAGSCEHNTGCEIHAYAHSHERIHQDVFPVANNLEFTAWQEESWGHMCGYRVTIDCFPSVVCSWGDAGTEHHEVDVRAEGATVTYSGYCEIDVEFWLTDLGNTVRKKDLQWTYEAEARPGPPDHGWVVPTPLCVVSHKYVTICNDDDTRSFTITDFKYLVSTANYTDLETVPFDCLTKPGNFTLPPGGCFTAKVYAPRNKGHVYFYYTMRNATNGGVLLEEWADHYWYLPCMIGGFRVPVNKLGLLAPYLGVASMVSIGAIAAVIYVKRVKRPKKKQ